MKIYGPKLEPRSKLGHENRRALEPENSAESEKLLIITHASHPGAVVFRPDEIQTSPCTYHSIVT